MRTRGTQCNSTWTHQMLEPPVPKVSSLCPGTLSQLHECPPRLLGDSPSLPEFSKPVRGTDLTTHPVAGRMPERNNEESHYHEPSWCADLRIAGGTAGSLRTLAAAPQKSGMSWRSVVVIFAAEHFRHPAWGYSHCVRDYELARPLASQERLRHGSVRKAERLTERYATPQRLP